VLEGHRKRRILARTLAQTIATDHRVMDHGQ
jgi:hypothetical protein